MLRTWFSSTPTVSVKSYLRCWSLLLSEETTAIEVTTTTTTTSQLMTTQLTTIQSTTEGDTTTISGAIDVNAVYSTSVESTADFQHATEFESDGPVRGQITIMDQYNCHPFSCD